MPSNETFSAMLRKSRCLLAPLVSIRDSSVSEMLSFLSPDFLIVDMEHSSIDVPELQNILMAAKPMHVVARIRGLEKNEVKKVLDTGVSGIIVPGIETPQDVKDAVVFSRVPPAGVRGVGPGRASKYGYGFKDYVLDSGNSAVMIQIETKKAYDSLDEILDVPGIDGCFIGPVDLSTALQIEFSWNNSTFVEAIDRIVAAARKRNLITGIYSPLANRAPEPILSRGFNYLMYGADREAIQLKYLESLQFIREKLKAIP